jgi:TonB family protein
MYAPQVSMPSLPPSSPSEYQQAFAGKEDKIVWYKFHELPKITPQKSSVADQPLRAEVQAKQSIVSSPKDAPQRDQVILTPMPTADLPPLDLPNLLAVKLPPKQFTTPPDLVQPEPVGIPAPDVPAGTQVEQLASSAVPTVRLPPKPYVPPETSARPQTLAKIDPPTAPEDYVPQSKLSTKLPAIRLPSRPFVPPAPQPLPEKRKIEAATEAPVLQASTPVAAVLPAAKLPARAFAPPPPATPQEKKAVAPPQVDANAGDVTIAIASLKPAATPVKLPDASSPARFSAGETVRPDGATSDGASKGIVVPDLYAHAPDGSDDKKKTDLLALVTAAPGSKAFTNDSLRYSRPVASGEATIPSIAPRATATRVANAPDRRFNGRDVYMMAIQMSNLTSYSGSWLMWYSESAVRQTDTQAIAAPVPHRKVDPKYSASAISDRVEGRVQLFCVIGREGNVSSIELLRGVDDRLNRSAEEALSKWEFYPATRNGEPVDVDVVVEIPFVLAPQPFK